MILNFDARSQIVELQGRPTRHFSIQPVKPRNQPDFAAVYDEHVWAVFGFFSYRLRATGDAEDLTQLTFERALRAWPRFDPAKASANTWLLTIARNLLIDHFRGRARRVEVPLEEIHETALGQSLGPSPLGLEPELAAAMAELPTRDQEIVALRFGGDLAGPEIAEITGLTLANVQQILSRSLRRMRVALETPAGDS